MAVALAFAIAGSLTAAAPAYAQTATSAEEFSAITARFVAQIPEDRKVRIAVFAPSIAAAGVDASAAAIAAEQVTSALLATRRPSTRPIELTDVGPGYLALSAVGLPSSEGVPLKAISNAGRAVSANYAIVATAQRPTERSLARVLLQFVNVTQERSIDTLTTRVPAPRPVASRAPIVPAAPPPVPVIVYPTQTPSPTKPPRFWPAQKIALATGFGLSAAAGVRAWSLDRELRARRKDILEIPAGATEEFSRQVAAARDLGRTRDFWWAVAIGGAAVTTSYAIVTASPSIGPVPSTAKRTPKWRVLVNPFRPAVSLVRSF